MKNYKTRFLLGISLVSAMGGLLFGYDWVVIGGAKPFYERFFEISNSPALQGWAMSSALIGCMVGAIISGSLSDRFGRKRLLILSGAVFMVSAIGTGAAESMTIFILYRLLGGVAIGLASTLSPMYIAEIAPKEVRGKFVSINQLTIVIGILAAQIANMLIAKEVPTGATDLDILNSWNGQQGWRWMFWAEIIPASLFFLLMFLIPESPRWLAKRGYNDKAEAVLLKIGNKSFATQALSDIRESLQNDSRKVDFKALFAPGMKKILLIGIVLAAFQQWCGINVIFNYAEEIFSAAGYAVDDIMFNIVITGSVNLVFCLIALYTVDKLGRRPLLLLGAGSLAVIYAVMGTLFFFEVKGLPLLILVITAIAAYSMTLAPVVWVVLSEIFPNRIRGAAMAVGTLALWSACFILTYTFPMLNSGLGASGTFWLYGVICVLGFLFILKKLPETRQKSLEQIEKELLNS
ncbi:MAG: sugar porter family MFS transporter [Bacteroidales bacterium]|nr:sugar porter family MFS transporter [Bacteroidales bacterium]